MNHHCDMNEETGEERVDFDVDQRLFLSRDSECGNCRYIRLLSLL